MAGRILVTGGNIGSPIVDGLIAAGYTVRITGRRRIDNPVWAAAGVEQVEFDYGQPETLARAFADVETYVSISPLIENLVETGIQSVEAAVRAGVSRIVRSSALGAAEDAITLGRWHRQVEKAVEASGTEYTILQPASFFQNYLSYADSIRREGTIYAPLGEGRASLVDVRDFAEGIVRVLTSPGHAGKTYRITGGGAISVSEIAAVLSEVLDKPVRYVPVDEATAEQAMREAQMPAWLIDNLTELNRITAAGYVAAVSPDLAGLLGRPPRTFREFALDARQTFD
jgi:uncharacterized protein YbjT (DUF2867 family)